MASGGLIVTDRDEALKARGFGLPPSLPAAPRPPLSSGSLDAIHPPLVHAAWMVML